MPSVLINKLLDEYHYPLIDEFNIDDFIHQHPLVVLFFSENPKQFPESNDVAVVLPELMKRYPQIQPALVSQSSQRKLQGRFGFSTWPSLVFLREGKYLGVISQIQNWDEYLRLIEQLLNSQASSLPRITIPVVSQSSPCHNH